MIRFSAVRSSGRLSAVIGTPAVDQTCRCFRQWFSRAAAAGAGQLSPLALAARFAAAFASRCPPATTHRDALFADADLAEEVEVIDPRHPLYRRRFRLLSVVQSQRSAGFVSVEYCLDISLNLPISATSLQAVFTHNVPTKLSLEALGDLLAVAGEREGGCRSSPAMSGKACLRPCAGRSRMISPSSSGR